MLLVMAVLASGLGIVYTKHRSRQLFIDLQELQRHRDSMEIEWEQLQLEESTHTTAEGLDHRARTRLDMFIPESDAVVYLKR